MPLRQIIGLTVSFLGATDHRSWTPAVVSLLSADPWSI